MALNDSKINRGEHLTSSVVQGLTVPLSVSQVLGMVKQISTGTVTFCRTEVSNDDKAETESETETETETEKRTRENQIFADEPTAKWTDDDGTSETETETNDDDDMSENEI